VSDALLCAGDAVTLKVDSIAGVNAVWSSSAGFSAKQSAVILKNVSAASAGKYYVYYKKGSCISSTDSVSFEVLTAPVVKADSLKLIIGTTKFGNITDNDQLKKGQGYKITWQQPGGQLGLFVGKENGEFQFTAGSQTGSLDIAYDICYSDCPDACLYKQVLHIEIVNSAPVACRVPNLLTPNNDGFNDVLYVDCIGANRGANLYVYSQWGELVYSSTDYRNDWNGTWKNKPLPDGTYFFVFQLDDSQEAQKGFISIFR
jgi:gliding motility-associated-like protein